MTARIGRWALLLGLLVFVPTALADHSDGYERGRRRHGQWGYGLHEGRPPPGQPMNKGHYERRTTQEWVEGYYQNVWVPRTCAARPIFPFHVRCVGGYYDQRWVPGHYEAREQWVWVPGHRAWRFGRAG